MTNEPTVELKPCPLPWCGSGNTTVCTNASESYFWCRCNQCTTENDPFPSKDEATSNWNNRPLEQELVEALEEMIDELNAFVITSGIDTKDPRNEKATWYRRRERARAARDKAKGKA